MTNIVQVPSEEFDDEEGEDALQAVVDLMRKPSSKSQVTKTQTLTVQPVLVEA